MEKIKQTQEKIMFDVMRDAIEQTAKDLETQGISPIKLGNPTPTPQGEATREEIETIVSFFPNLLGD